MSISKIRPAKLRRFRRYSLTFIPQFSFTCRGTFAYPYPGRSTNRISGLISKKLISCVRPGVLLVRAKLLTPVSVLIALDLPVLERPVKATSEPKSEGQSLSEGALIRNLTLW